MPSDLTQYLDDAELALVVEGLIRLRAIKQEAFEVVTQPWVPGGERFRPADFAIPQIGALLARFGETPAVALADLPEGPRIIGPFFIEAWGDASGNDAVEVATRLVLAMDLDDIHQLKASGAICHLFEVDDLSSITEDILQAKREAFGVEPPQALSP